MCAGKNSLHFRCRDRQINLLFLCRHTIFGRILYVTDNITMFPHFSGQPTNWHERWCTNLINWYAYSIRHRCQDQHPYIIVESWWLLLIVKDEITKYCPFSSRWCLAYVGKAREKSRQTSVETVGFWRGFQGGGRIHLLASPSPSVDKWQLHLVNLSYAGRSRRRAEP
jgi:hypothetical protein